ncbi:MAG: ADP-ribosylglycohydrolase family protein [Erysipelotrichaceae bacterium]|nr:ADP-ribosylglycohydrolase family protein [Erysipelotrichaceae bacterium]
MDYSWYLKTTYASWLGKLIGIRLGAPVENWTHSMIKEKYGEVNDYLVDYDIFAADDDSNGPLFFVRALLDHDPFNIKAEDIGNTILNYLQEYHGFFWWGGVGVSTEHTAYENLKNGFNAPLSGSKETNGIVLAEQIGGQIFSDCWGYVSGNDPLLAKELAIKAASVTHDENGIQGAIFVAVATCLAYEMNDSIKIIKATLKYLDHNMEYSQVVNDIIRFYYENPSDWHECLTYIHQNYGYDKYAGICHIIPNTAIMIMALCYGENDFSNTLTMLCECGWDTDCNCGNVGSIMGAMVKLEGIDSKWLLPLNDTLICSSMIGYLNNTTISNSTRLFTDLAFILKNKADLIPDYDQYDFHLPYATNGFRGINALLSTESDMLKVQPQQLTDITIYKYSYFLPGTIYDTRYEPSFSPILYPNETVSFTVKTESTITVQLFVKDSNGISYQSLPEIITDQKVINYQIPSEIEGVICEFGIHQTGVTSLDPWYIKKIEIDKTPKFKINFSNHPWDDYGEVFGGGKLRALRGWVVHSGKWDSNDEGLVGISLKDSSAFIISGDPNVVDYSLQIAMCPQDGYDHYVVFNCKGNMHYNAIGFCEGGIKVIEKDVEVKTLSFIPCQWRFHKNYILKMTIKNGIMNAMIHELGLNIETAYNINDAGLYGFLLKDGSSCLITGFELACPI